MASPRLTPWEVLCAEYGSPCVPLPPRTMIAFATRTLGADPIHGTRVLGAPGDIEWFLWCGDLPTDTDVFDPYHLEHLPQELTRVLPYLALAPGYRFLLGEGDYVDVWKEDAPMDEPN